MDSVAWWPTVFVVVMAAVIDIHSRRIPNWLSLPFLAGGVVVSALQGGWPGMMSSITGIGLATTVVGILCYLRAMGMGDLKLLAGVGAWVGPGQLVLALVVTGIAGGFLAVGYAIWHGSLGRSLDGTADLIREFPKQGFRPHLTITLDNAVALKMPYAPAIAIGTIFSFFAR
jgi:prepilin peptidase CpaA